tara:strand:+ start:13410 stop:13643 length:234 start_codon:yes stop_codon:yes gene_type:complete
VYIKIFLFKLYSLIFVTIAFGFFKDSSSMPFRRFHNIADAILFLDQMLIFYQGIRMIKHQAVPEKSLPQRQMATKLN